MIKTYSFTTDEDDQLTKKPVVVVAPPRPAKKVEHRAESKSSKHWIFFALIFVVISIYFLSDDRWLARLIQPRQSAKAPVKEKILEEETTTPTKVNDDRPKKRDETSALAKKSSYRTISHRVKNSSATKINPNVVLLKSEDLIDDLRRELQSRCAADRHVCSQVSKVTGLSKEQWKKFLYEKNNEILHLKSFLSLLDYFQLMIFIVPK